MQNFIAKLIGAIINLIGFFAPKTAGTMALKLFSTPKRIDYKELQLDFLGTAYKEELHYEGLPLMTYRWLGKKETVLLAHGWESNSFRWKSLIERLKKLDYTIVSLDAPAHGRSGGSQFNALLYAECINVVAKRFKANVIVGHSVGGMSAAFFMHKYQMPSVEKLVLLGAPSNFVGVFKRYTDMMGYSTKVINALNHLIFERFNQHPDYFNVAKFSSEIQAEGLIVHDENDRIIPYSDARDFSNYYKKSKLITTNGLGHGLRNDEVNEHIISFISA